jgi:hypothetical protein
MAKHDIRIYVIRSDGAYLYNVEKHALDPVVEGDHRSLVAGSSNYFQVKIKFRIHILHFLFFRILY